jgi:hypothetical protein
MDFEIDFLFENLKYMAITIFLNPTFKEITPTINQKSISISQTNCNLKPNEFQ